MAKLVAQLKPKRVLEVGTLIDYSAILMGKELGSDAEIDTIEIDRGKAEVAKKNIEKAEIKPKVQVIVGDASRLFRSSGEILTLSFLMGIKASILST